jgi:transposase
MKNTSLAHRRHDLSDDTWKVLEPHLPGREGVWGGVAKDNRLFINAVFWIIRTGAPWRDLPPDLGNWSKPHRRFLRWRDKGIWETLLDVLIDEPDYEWRMIDASHCKVPPHAAGAKGGNQEMGRTKGGSTPRSLWPWMRMVCRSESLLHKVPQRIAHRLAACWKGSMPII